MVGMIFKPQNKSFRHFLSFRNKLTLLPLKTYVVGDDVVGRPFILGGVFRRV